MVTKLSMKFVESSALWWWGFQSTFVPWNVYFPKMSTLGSGNWCSIFFGEGANKPPAHQPHSPSLHLPHPGLLPANSVTSPPGQSGLRTRFLSWLAGRRSKKAQGKAVLTQSFDPPENRAPPCPAVDCSCHPHAQSWSMGVMMSRTVYSQGH